MKYKSTSLFFALAILVLVPCAVRAQGGTPPPPPCCKSDSEPPPAPAIIAQLPGSGEAGALSQIIISDATLSAMGMTRAEFLDAVAAGLFAGNSVCLVIPFTLEIATPALSADTTAAVTASADGSVSEAAPSLYLRIGKSLVAADTIDTLDLLYLTDGQVCVGVVFIRDAHV
jgi:hypothetical protein